MNCSLIFRGQLNYPFQLIFSFPACASYGSFNASSVCILITHGNRIYNYPGKEKKKENQMHIGKRDTNNAERPFVGFYLFPISSVHACSQIQLPRTLYFSPDTRDTVLPERTPDLIRYRWLPYLWMYYLFIYVFIYFIYTLKPNLGMALINDLSGAKRLFHSHLHAVM